MMAIDGKQIELAEQIDLTRCYAASDRAIAEKRRKERLLAMAASGNDSDKRWYVLRTSNRAERDVHNLLTEAGIETWLPMKVTYTEVKFTRRKRKSERPLFRNYLFVRVLPHAESWAGLACFDGAVSLLCSDGRPLAIAEKIMSSLIELHSSGVFNDRKNAQLYKVGDVVEITSGPLAMFKGEIEGYVRKREVRVLASIFGRETVVEVRLDQITKS